MKALFIGGLIGTSIFFGNWGLEEHKKLADAQRYIAILTDTRQNALHQALAEADQMMDNCSLRIHNVAYYVCQGGLNFIASQLVG